MSKKVKALAIAVPIALAIVAVIQILPYIWGIRLASLIIGIETGTLVMTIIGLEDIETKDA